MSETMQVMENPDRINPQIGPYFKSMLDGIFNQNEKFGSVEPEKINRLFNIMLHSLSNDDYQLIDAILEYNPFIGELSLNGTAPESFDDFDAIGSPTKGFLVWTLFWCDLIPYEAIKNGEDFTSILRVLIYGRDYLEYCRELRQIQQHINTFQPQYKDFYSYWHRRFIKK
ncbi:hypothetical protein Aperf_G00000106681 [Anoplocephala perfoliata]